MSGNTAAFMEFEVPVDCRVHTNQLLNLSPSQLNLISVLTPYSLQLHFNIIFLHTPMSHKMSLEALCHLHAWNTPVWRFMLRNFLMSLPLFVNPSVFLRIARQLRGFLFPFSSFATTSLGFITLDTIFKLGPLQHGGS